MKSIPISNYEEIDDFISQCENLKSEPLENTNSVPNSLRNQPRIAYLSPCPIDIEMVDVSKVLNHFEGLAIEVFLGVLNIKTLALIQDFDFIVIISKVFKSNLYIEDDNLKSSTMSATEICSHIPNENIPIVFITNESIDIPYNHPCISISSFKNATLNRFVFKTLRESKLEYNDDDIQVNLANLYSIKIEKGSPIIRSLYGNDRNLSIGKKILQSVVGRIEEQASLANRLLSIIKSNKVLNVKASGGTGKTTLIKKVAYELYNRGYFKNGVSFKSCESVKNYSDLEDSIIDAFGLTNIINFKDYIIDNYSSSKVDLLIILDNFETVVNALSTDDIKEVKNLLFFISDYAHIAITSRERFSDEEDLEDVFSLTPLITDDALKLFQLNYGVFSDKKEIEILRAEILEDLLNNNPLAIKLVTKSRTRYPHISQLRDLLNEHFFESTNENYSDVFKNSGDLNIERTKSIYQSINYSYATLNSKEKIAFELLSLFPDGISLSNFKICFQRNDSKNQISDKELRTLRDKSLLEDYNGIIQLQPIIRRFAEFQFSKKPIEIKKKYCLDAYSFNCFILDVLDFFEKKNSRSYSLNIFNGFKNNLINVLNYMDNIEFDAENKASDKELLLNFIFALNTYIVNEKQFEELHKKLELLRNFFADLPQADIFINVIKLNNNYFHKEFDETYSKFCEILGPQQMEVRVFSNETKIERLYKGIVSNIHSMEGYTFQRILGFINNNEYSYYLSNHFFYLGIGDNLVRNRIGFYGFEYDYMFKKLDAVALEKYIDSIYPEEHLEIMQSTYTLSKVKPLERKRIMKLVVTNPYTKGLRDLMIAFTTNEEDEKIKHFERALNNLYHIKYYYLEALYHFCLFLKKSSNDEYKIKLQEGLELSQKFYYQYLNFIFKNIDNIDSEIYDFKYSYYPDNRLESFVKKHNESWRKNLKDKTKLIEE